MENNVMNPFVVGKYLSDDYFCDREQETEFLIKQIENGRNVALISPRRMGKTGLIQHCFAQKRITESYNSFFVDIYATTSLSEFVFVLGKAIFEGLKPKRIEWKERFFQVIRSLRMGFKLDAITGEPTFDISLGDIQSPQTTIDEIFEYLETADKPCVVAIDEFQQIGEYAEKNDEALLRTKIQQCRQTQFVFSGSRRHTMSNMFNSSSKPFYQSAIMMGLEPIPQETYVDFAIRLFEQYGRQINRDVIDMVYKKYEGFTWFVQMMMNELFALTPKGETCTVDLLEQAHHNIVQMQEMGFKEQLASLAPKQKQLLQAIAKEHGVNGITSSSFIKKYNLPSASSVQAALKPLLKSDIVVMTNGFYRIYDYFFADWIEKEF